jgi:hypothetical protein
MSAWECPLGCPVAARTSAGFAWSEVLRRHVSAATFTPTRWAK